MFVKRDKRGLPFHIMKCIVSNSDENRATDVEVARWVGQHFVERSSQVHRGSQQMRWPSHQWWKGVQFKK